MVVCTAYQLLAVAMLPAFFTFYARNRVENPVKLFGKILDKKGEPVASANIVATTPPLGDCATGVDMASIKTAIGISDKEGNYSVIAERGKNYGIRVSHKDYYDGGVHAGSVDGDTRRDVVLKDLSEIPPDFMPVDKESHFVKRVTPNYPASLIGSGKKGKVVLMILVVESGEPTEIRILKDNGTEFVTAAIEAAKESRYSPAEHRGKVIKHWLTIPYSFSETK